MDTAAVLLPGQWLYLSVRLQLPSVGNHSSFGGLAAPAAY